MIESLFKKLIFFLIFFFSGASPFQRSLAAKIGGLKVSKWVKVSPRNIVFVPSIGTQHAVAKMGVAKMGSIMKKVDK